MRLVRGNQAAIRGLRLLNTGRAQATDESFGRHGKLRALGSAPNSPAGSCSPAAAGGGPGSSSILPNLRALSSHTSRRYLRAMASATEAESVDPEPFKLALCQLQVTEDKDANITSAERAVKEAASNGASVVVLPEMWNCPYSNESFPVYAEDLDSGDSPSMKALSTLAKDLSIYVVGGSIPERQRDKLYNTCCVFSPEGDVIAKYRKCHLFDIDIPGKITFKESDTLTGGDALTVVDTKYGKFGLGICYDMRFPEMAMIYAKRGVQMIIYPGAFNMVTGPVHWQLLQQARAVDNQLYVATCSPARDEKASYTAWGHSTVVGPFAEVIASMDHLPGIVYADIDLKQCGERRLNMPLRKQKRADLYDLQDCRNKVGFRF